MQRQKFIITVLILIIIIGLIGLGFSAIQMVDKWINRKAKAEAAQQVLNCIRQSFPFKKQPSVEE